MPDSSSVRRTPQQSRSQQRVDHLLDTAATIFAELGYENATTNTIAARAGISIGSLYQFFPNKEALLEALVARYVTALRAKITTTMTPEAMTGFTMREAIERIVAAMGAFEMTHAGFKTIFVNTHAEAAQSVHQEIVAAVEQTLMTRFPALPEQEGQLGARVLVGIVKGLMMLSEAPDNMAQQVIGQEMATALLAYLRALLLRNNIELPPDLI